MIGECVLLGKSFLTIKTFKPLLSCVCPNMYNKVAFPNIQFPTSTTLVLPLTRVYSDMLVEVGLLRKPLLAITTLEPFLPSVCLNVSIAVA